jgi:hypothetical protein
MRTVLQRLFGPLPLQIHPLPAGGDKVIQYTSDLPDPHA